MVGDAYHESESNPWLISSALLFRPGFCLWMQGGVVAAGDAEADVQELEGCDYDGCLGEGVERIFHQRGKLKVEDCEEEDRVQVRVELGQGL